MKNLTINREFYDNLAKVGSLSTYYEPKSVDISFGYNDGQNTDKDAENYLRKHHFEFIDKVRCQEGLDIFNECGVLSVHDNEAKILAFEAHGSWFLEGTEWGTEWGSVQFILFF